MVHPRYRILNADSPHRDAAAVADARLSDHRRAGAGGLAQTDCARAAEVDLGEVLDATGARRIACLPLAAAVPPARAAARLLPQAALQSRSHPAWRRIKFDELLAQQLSLRRAYLARRRKGAPVLPPPAHSPERLKAACRFALTGAQQRVAAEIAADLEQPYPMQRLLQGDVGCGKTIVAALAICQAIEAGYQAAFMAPTEILAEQHFLKLRAWLEPLGVEVTVPGGRSRQDAQAGEATAGRDDGATGGRDARADPGRHRFCPPRLAIVDEQHRFGVVQRLELRRKGAIRTS
jgi:ATP-dependent DNA helicase RecG